MTTPEFIQKFGSACGGNWTAMLMSAIRQGLPEVHAKMEDREYNFTELYAIIDAALAPSRPKCGHGKLWTVHCPDCQAESEAAMEPTVGPRFVS